MKKLCSVLLAILLLCSLAVPALAAGTPNVVIVSTPQELLAVAERVNGGDSMKDFLVTLAQDIDMNDYDWPAIGQRQTTPFSGGFDGKGHVISNLHANLSDDTTERQAGLFGTLQGAHVSDVKLTGCYFTAKNIVGGIAAINRNSLIEKCSFSGRISVYGDRSGAGGIAGYSTGTIKNCHTTGTVNGLWQLGGVAGIASGQILVSSFDGKVIADCERRSSSEFANYESVGGIVGCLLPDGNVDNCLSVGSVEVHGAYEAVGGVVGYVGAQVQHCYSTSQITCDGGVSVGVGGVAGFIQTGKVSNCAALNSGISLSHVSAGWGRVVGDTYVSPGSGNVLLGIPEIGENYAVTSMKVTLAGEPVEVKDSPSSPLEHKDGVGVPAAGLTSRTFWTDLGFSFSDNTWLWNSGKMPTLNTSVAAAPVTPVTPPLSFPDIKGHWAEKQILAVAETGIMQGDTEGTFRPEDRLTRAELCAVMCRFLNLEPVEETQFTDVSGWAVGSIGALAQTGIVKGDGDGTFRPNDPITRQETAAILCRALSLPYAPVEMLFADDALIDDWAKDDVYHVQAVGLMIGDGNRMFHPQDPLTRAEIATIIYRLQNTDYE